MNPEYQQALVKIVEEDYGPATKILPCAKLYRGTQTRIVYCDDDRFADWSWLESLSNAAIKRKNDVIVSSGMQLEKYGVECKKPNFQPRAVDRVIKNDAVYRYARLQQKFFEIIKRKKLPKLNRSYYERSGYVDIAMGVGGVSVNPSFFDDACYDIPDVLWTVDDIWLSASYARQGIGIWADEIVKMPTGTAASNIADLASSIIEGKGRNAADQYAISYIQETFDVWK